MAWVSNGRDVTALMRAIQEYTRLSVIEAKLPKKSEFDIKREAAGRTNQAWRDIEKEIDRLTANKSRRNVEVNWMGDAE